jgi:hypothetical protein
VRPEITPDSGEQGGNPYEHKVKALIDELGVIRKIYLFALCVVGLIVLLAVAVRLASSSSASPTESVPGIFVLWGWVALVASLAGLGYLTYVGGQAFRIQRVTTLDAKDRRSLRRGLLFGVVPALTLVCLLAAFLLQSHRRGEWIGREQLSVKAEEDRLASEVCAGVLDDASNSKPLSATSLREPVLVLIDGSNRQVSKYQSPVVPLQYRPSSERPLDVCVFYWESWIDSPSVTWDARSSSGASSPIRPVRLRQWRVRVFDARSGALLRSGEFVGLIEGVNVVGLEMKGFDEAARTDWEERHCLTPVKPVLRSLGISVTDP